MVRLCARRSRGGKNVVALTDPEIAIDSGLPLSRVLEIGEMTDWGDVTVSEAERFCSACRFDPTSAVQRKRQAIYVFVCQKKRPNKPPHYLQASPHWETVFLPLIQKLRSCSGS